MSDSAKSEAFDVHGCRTKKWNLIDNSSILWNISSTDQALLTTVVDINLHSAILFLR